MPSDMFHTPIPGEVWTRVSPGSTGVPVKIVKVSDKQVWFRAAQASPNDAELTETSLLSFRRTYAPIARAPERAQELKEAKRENRPPPPVREKRRSPLTPAVVREIDALVRAGQLQVDVARAYGVVPSIVSEIVNRKAFASVWESSDVVAPEADRPTPPANLPVLSEPERRSSDAHLLGLSDDDAPGARTDVAVREPDPAPDDSGDGRRSRGALPRPGAPGDLAPTEEVTPDDIATLASLVDAAWILLETSQGLSFRPFLRVDYPAIRTVIESAQALIERINRVEEARRC